MLQKLASLFLLLGVLATLVACGGKKPPADTGEKTATDESGGTDGAVTVPTNDPYYPTLPSEMDFDDAEIRILQRKEYESEMKATEDDPDTIAHAIWVRNNAVETQLGVRLNYLPATGSNKTYEAEGGMQSVLVNNMSAGPKDCFHLISNYAAKGVILVTQGVYSDFSNLPYLDTTRGWWDSSYIDASSYGEKIYSLVGAANTLATERLHVCFINFDVAAQHFPDRDFYQTVFDEKWTFNELLTTIAQVGYAESNGGTWGIGLGYNSTSADGFLIALGVKIVEKNAQGVPTLVMSDAKNDTVCTALKELYNSNGAAANDWASINGTKYTGRTAFTEGKALFYVDTFSYARNRLRDADFQYGIMPLPMWEEGDGYRTTPQNEYSCFSIMCSLPQEMYEAVGAVTESLAYHSYVTVHPVLFERAYQYQYSGDNPEAVRMYNLLVSSRVYDFGYIYSNAIGRPVFVFRDFVVQNQSGLADKIAGMNFGPKLSEFLAYFK